MVGERIVCRRVEIMPESRFWSWNDDPNCISSAVSLSEKVGVRACDRFAAALRARLHPKCSIDLIKNITQRTVLYVKELHSKPLWTLCESTAKSS